MNSIKGNQAASLADPVNIFSAATRDLAQEFCADLPAVHSEVQA